MDVYTYIVNMKTLLSVKEKLRVEFIGLIVMTSDNTQILKTGLGQNWICLRFLVLIDFS